MVAAFITGWLSERGWDRSVVRLFVAMAIGHIVIMAMGFAWLAYGMKLGAEKAWLVGVLPFLAGALVKNALGRDAGTSSARNGRSSASLNAGSA